MIKNNVIIIIIQVVLAYICYVLNIQFDQRIYFVFIGLINLTLFITTFYFIATVLEDQGSVLRNLTSVIIMPVIIIGALLAHNDMVLQLVKYPFIMVSYESVKAAVFVYVLCLLMLLCRQGSKQKKPVKTLISFIYLFVVVFSYFTGW